MLAALAMPLAAGCGGDDDESTRIRGNTVTIYSSLPRHGVSAGDGVAVAAGQLLAIQDAGGHVGRLRVRLVELDSSEPDDLTWSPDAVSGNAERAADDPTTIAYVGELDLGGSAVSLPITNDAGILQVAPLDGLTSLTRRAPGRPRAGPERYYPEGNRSFLRLVPDDLVGIDVLLRLVRKSGAKRIAILHDDRIYGRELGIVADVRARDEQLVPIEVEEPREDPDSVDDLVRDLAPKSPDAIVYVGAGGAKAAPLLASLARQLPATPVFASAGLAMATPPRLAPAETTVVAPVRPSSTYSTRGRRVLRRLEKSGAPARVAALYGYESVQLVLDALDAKGADRRAVMRHVLARGPRTSLLGRLEIRRSGDVSEDRLAVYRLVSGRLEFDRVVHAGESE